MSMKERGVTPLDRFRSRLDRTDRTCEACGYEDEQGGWVAETSGRRVRYRHVCPSCRAETTREYSFR